MQLLNWKGHTDGSNHDMATFLVPQQGGEGEEIISFGLENRLPKKKMSVQFIIVFPLKMMWGYTIHHDSTPFSDGSI